MFISTKICKVTFELGGGDAESGRGGGGRIPLFTKPYHGKIMKNTRKSYSRNVSCVFTFL